MPLQIYVASRTDAKNKATSSPYPIKIQLESAQPTLGELKSQVANKISILKVERQRITKEDKKPLTNDELKLKDEGLKDGDTVWVKDLGPQVAWRTVFLTEYFGPLFIHPILYHFGQTIYRTQFEHSRMQTLVLYLVLLHYVKRELETIFIHRFSAATMPIFNIFKNSAHYWGLSGLLLGGAVYGPWSSASKVAGTIQDNDTFLIGCTAVWTLAQLGNLISHVILKNLRPAGTRVRKIPRGFAFELVSCPNYFFEIIGWVAITVLTLSPAAAVFAAVSAGQMAIWALKKHKAYRKEFKDYPRGRKAMIPFLF